MREEIKLQQEGGQPSHMQNLVSQLEMARENSSESTARRIFLDSLINKLTPEIETLAQATMKQVVETQAMFDLLEEAQAKKRRATEQLDSCDKSILESDRRVESLLLEISACVYTTL
jgi:hypothetical protein